VLRFSNVGHSIDRVNEWIGRIIKYGIFVITGVVFGEVIARYAFNAPTVWGMETSELLFGFFVLLAGGYCLLHAHHVKIDIVYRRWSNRMRAIVDCVTYGLMIFFCGVFIWYGFKIAWGATLMQQTTGTIWNPPLWPYKLVFTVGFVLLLLQALRNFSSYLRYAISGKGEPPL